MALLSTNFVTIGELVGPAAPLSPTILRPLPTSAEDLKPSAERAKDLKPRIGSVVEES